MKLRFKPVFTYAPQELKVRLFRVIRERGIVGDGQGYSAFVSVSFVPRLFAYHSATDEFELTILGLRVHRRRSYGGHFA